MIPSLPYSTAVMVGAVLPGLARTQGYVEKKTGDGVYVISLGQQKITVALSSGTLSVGDAVFVTGNGKELLIQIIAPSQAGVSLPADSLEVGAPLDGSTLRMLVDAVVKRLERQVVDKETFDRLQKILAAVAKDPVAFGEGTQAAIADLKKVVSDAQFSGADPATLAGELTDKILHLAETLGRQVAADSAGDVLLKPAAKEVEGYYAFDTVKQAIAWVVQQKDIGAKVPYQVLASLSPQAPVVVKVYESALGEMRAAFLSFDKVQSEIGHFVATDLHSDVWKGVSPGVLAKLLYDSKSFPLERLLQIDRLLAALGRQQAPPKSPEGLLPDAAPAASKGFDAAFGQWLRIALDPLTPVQEIACRVPARAPLPLPELFNRIDEAQLPSGAPATGSAKDSDFALQRETLTAAVRPEQIIPDFFRRLGLNLESSLLQADPKIVPGLKENNLKVLLLSLLRAIDSAAETSVARPQQGKETTVPSAAPSPEDAYAIKAGDSVVALVKRLGDLFGRVSDESQSVAAQLDLLSRPDTAAPKAAAADDGHIIDKVKTVRDMAVRLDATASFVRSTGEEISAGLSRAVRQIVDWTFAKNAGQPQPSQQPAQEAASLPVPLAIADGSTPQPLSRQAAVAGTEAIGQLASQLKDLIGQLQAFSRELSRAAESLAKESTAGASGDTEQALRRLVALAKSVSDRASDLSHEGQQRLKQIADETARLARHAGPAAEKSALDTLKQQVEHVLTRVESLQVLAKQVAVSDGQQQVITVPMRIEGQWTDVVIQFLKRKGSSRKESGKKNISVAIHVSPAMLGEITARMDYNAKKNFSLHLEFEKTATCAWFEKNRPALVRAFERLGFSAPKIDIKEVGRAGEGQPSGAVAIAPAGTIDITA
jgi:hypothetical protein